MATRQVLTASQRWVVKVGTALLTDAQHGLNHTIIQSLVAQIAQLQHDGIDIVLVSSGSIGEGMRRLGWARRPREVHRLQTAAAVGQMGLAQQYEAAFRTHDLTAAQILLTHADLANRQRYLNARSTLRELLHLKVVPIVNENDAVVNAEIRFGDNDTLAALATNLVEADCLILLTDQIGLYDRDPRHCAEAQLVRYASVDDPNLLAMAGAAGATGQGGMLTKIKAAQIAASSGATTLIASGQQTDILLQLHAGVEIGTLLQPGKERLAARKQWLAGQLRGNGQLVLDDGAVKVLQAAGKSLLPIGVTAAEGTFTRGEIVICVDPTGHEIARGLINYNADEVRKIIGLASHQIEATLGYRGESELIHRDNIALTYVH